MIGIGVQIAVMSIMTVFFVALTYLAENYRTNTLLEALLVLYTMTGLLSGYYSARFYKMMGGVHWVRSTLLTCSLVPSMLSCCFSLMEFSYLLEDSSHIIGIGAIFKLLFIWFCIQLPLTFLGSVVGFKRPKMEAGCSVNPVPYFIPPQPKILTR